jgi:hypothetical protein
MTTQNAVYDAVQALIVRLDADQKIIAPSWGVLKAVIRSHQNGPRPTGAHAVLTLLAERDEHDVICRAYRDMVTPAGPEPRAVETLTRSVAFLFQVEIMAANALDRARHMVAALANPPSIVDLPFTVMRVGEVKHDPELVQQRWEGRARFTLEIGARIASESIIDLIETVPVAVEQRGSDNALLGQASFTVSQP